MHVKNDTSKTDQIIIKLWWKHQSNFQLVVVGI